MDDLQRILAERSALYGRADGQVDTAGTDIETSLDRLSVEAARLGFVRAGALQHAAAAE